MTDLSAKEYEVLFQKIAVVHKLNLDIIARLKANTAQIPTAVLHPRVNETDLVWMEVVKHRLPQHSILHNWIPLDQPQFEDGEESNIFNDDLDLSVQGFQDLVRLNEAFKATADKFRMFDGQRSAPTLRLFLSNLEIVQANLGDIETRMNIDGRDEEIAELQEMGEELAKGLAEWIAQVAAWNRRNAPLNNTVTFDPASIKGVLLLNSKKKAIKKASAGHACVSSAETMWTSVTVELTKQQVNGWTLIGVCSDPLGATPTKLDVCNGWSLTSTGKNSRMYQLGATRNFDRKWKVGEQVTLSISGKQLKISGPKTAKNPWEDSMTLHHKSNWYFYVNLRDATLKIVNTTK